MQNYKIYARIAENENTLEFEKFMREIEARINNDSEIIERAKKCNLEFAKEIKETLKYPEREYSLGMIVENIKNKISRFCYIKNLEHNNKKYEAEIDLLERIFYLIEI